MKKALDGISKMGSVNFNTATSLQEFKDSLQKIQFAAINLQVSRTNKLNCNLQ